MCTPRRRVQWQPVLGADADPRSCHAAPPTAADAVCAGADGRRTRTPPVCASRRALDMLSSERGGGLGVGPTKTIIKFARTAAWHGVEEVLFWPDTEACRDLVWEFVQRILGVPVPRWCLTATVGTVAAGGGDAAQRATDADACGVLWRAPFDAANGLYYGLWALLERDHSAAVGAPPEVDPFVEPKTGRNREKDTRLGCWFALLPEPLDGYQ